MECHGDSLTAGAGAPPGESYPDQLGASLGAPWTVVNEGVGGANYQTMSALGPAIDARYVGERAKSIVVVWIGVNNLVLTPPESAAATYAGCRAFCEQRRAFGHLVIVCTLGAYNQGWGHEADRIEYNDLIRTNWTDFADALVDLGMDPDIGPAGSETNPVFFYDQVHMTATGYGLVASLIETEILAL